MNELNDVTMPDRLQRIIHCQCFTDTQNKTVC